MPENRGFSKSHNSAGEPKTCIEFALLGGNIVTLAGSMAKVYENGTREIMVGS